MPPASRTVPVAGDVLLRSLIRGEPVCARVVAATPAAAYAQLAAHPPGWRDQGIPEGSDRTAGIRPLVAVLTASAVRVPGGLLPALDAPGLVARLRPGEEVVLGGGAVVAGGVRLVPTRWWDSRVPRLKLDAGPGGRRPAEPDLPAPAVAVRPGARALELALTGGRPAVLERAVAALVGLGPGLTPAGDDVVAGTLVALSAVDDRPRRERLGTAVRPLLRRTTLVSAALLEHAAAGRAVPELARYVAALTRGRIVGAVVQDLLRVGASSGIALAWGARIGLRAAAAGPLPTSLEVA